MFRLTLFENLIFFEPRPLQKFFAIVLVLNIGCSPTPEGKTATAREPSWEQMILEVRSTKSDEIRFTESPVEPEQAEMLKIACQKLTVLHLDQSKLNSELLADVLSLLPQLQELKLVGAVDNLQLKTIAKLASQLSILNLPAGRFDDDGMQSLEAMKGLTLLRFHSHSVTNSGLDVFTELKELKFLHLIDVPMTDAGLPKIAAIEDLQSFYLDGSRCTDEGLSKFIKDRPNLHFHWNQLHLDHDPHSHKH